MKPIIGIIPSINETENQYYSNVENAEAIKRAGGLPYLLPYTMSKADMERLVNVMDGLYLAGGNDVDPKYYGESPHVGLGEVNPERDAFELEMLATIFKYNKPVLGICKGMQMINVALGGDLYQDITEQFKNKRVQHKQQAKTIHPTHPICIERGTRLQKIINEEKLYVNSYHHQAVRRLGDSLTASGHATDGIIEAIESTAYSFVIGVQWHPEFLLQSNDTVSLKIYKSFIHHCQDDK